MTFIFLPLSSLNTLDTNIKMSEIKPRSGALKLKGEEGLLAKRAKKKAKKEKKKAKKRKLDEKPDISQLDEQVHGGWYKVPLLYIQYTF